MSLCWGHDVQCGPVSAPAWGVCSQAAKGQREVCSHLQELWLQPQCCNKEQTPELLVLEQLLDILPQEIPSWEQEHNTEACAEAGALSGVSAGAGGG